MSQLELFSPHREPLAPAPAPRQTTGARALARSTDSPSSHAAAANMEATGALSDHASRIMAVLDKGGGWTAHEIAEAINLSNVQVSRRLSTLPGVRKMDDDGMRVCKVTGKRSAVYWSIRFLEGE